jgi:hypothetical protein
MLANFGEVFPRTRELNLLLMRTSFTWPVVCALLLAVARPRAAEGLQAWFVPSATKVLRDAKPVPNAQEWELAAARNEVEACQLVLRCDQLIPGVSVVASELRRAGGGILKAQLYKVEYVPNIVGETPYPDPLPPLKGLDLEPGLAQPVWISVRVGKAAKPGLYSGKLTVAAAGNRKAFPLRVRVWDFALPERPASDTAFGIDGHAIARQHHVEADTAHIRQLYAKYYEALLDHRISAYQIPVDLLSPEAANFLQDPRLTSFCIPYPGADGELKKLAAHLVKQGWFSKGYFYPIDEPVKKDAYDELARIAERLRKLAPAYHWVVPFFCRPDWDKNLTAFDLMTGRVNIWCPNLNYFDLEPLTRPYLAERRSLGEKVWWYVCCGPGAPYSNFFVEMPAMAHRMLFWQQKRENVDGLLYWCTTYWNPASTQNPWKNMMTVKDINQNIRGDGSLFYPGWQVGVDGPVSSLRLEVIRDGLEDFDWLSLADALLGKEVTSGYVNRLARSLKDYEQDPLALEKVRRELGAKLEAAARLRRSR